VTPTIWIRFAPIVFMSINVVQHRPVARRPARLRYRFMISS